LREAPKFNPNWYKSRIDIKVLKDGNCHETMIFLAGRQEANGETVPKLLWHKDQQTSATGFLHLTQFEKK